MVEPYRNICCFFGIDNFPSLLQQYDRILDCPAGASSFVAEANRLGAKVLGCDPLFGGSLERVVKRGNEDTDRVIEKVKIALICIIGISINQ